MEYNAHACTHVCMHVCVHMNADTQTQSHKHPYMHKYITRKHTSEAINKNKLNISTAKHEQQMIKQVIV